jgi:hypothetical protein
MQNQQQLKALKSALTALEAVTDAMHYEAGLPVTFLEGSQIERMYFDMCGVLVEVDEAVKAAETPVKKYCVTYLITRREVYDIEATDEEDAGERGYTEGTLIEYEGETTNVIELSAELLDKNDIVRYDTNTIAE